jgi:hypothetical protein
LTFFNSIPKKNQEGKEMKNLIRFKHLIYIFFAGVFTILFQSCIVYNPYNYSGRYNDYKQPLLPVSDIIQMSKDSVSSKDIITEIRRLHMVYWLKADQLAKLRDDGVQDSVINYMEKTHIDAVSRNQRLADSYYWWPGSDGYLYAGLGWGWPYYAYWGWNIGSAILFSGQFGHGGGFHGGYHGGLNGGRVTHGGGGSRRF